MALIGTAYCYLNVKLMARTAQRLGKTQDQEHYAEIASKICDGFNQRLFDRSTAQYDSGTQTSYVLPQAFGMVAEEFRSRVIQNLIDDIMVKHRGATSVGLIGMQWLMDVLTEIGHTDVALTIATRTRRPSWGYMIAKGATTVWERYDTDKRDPGMNSEALLVQIGGLNTWFYKGLAGIHYDPEYPGYKNIIMRPRMVNGLMSAKAWVGTSVGKVSSNWLIEDEQFSWELVVPPNATATVYMPTQDANRVTEGGAPIVNSKNVTFLRIEGKSAVYRVSSGTYKFASSMLQEVDGTS